MNAELKRIDRLTRVIDAALNRADSTLDYDRTVDAIALLAGYLHSYEGETEDWLYLNEHGTTPDNIVVGAYRHLTEWHAGQWSPTYAALCACGLVFSPGPCANGPEPESCEADVCEALNTMAEARRDARIMRDLGI